MLSLYVLPAGEVLENVCYREALRLLMYRNISSLPLNSARDPKVVYSGEVPSRSAEDR